MGKTCNTFDSFSFSYPLHKSRFPNIRKISILYERDDEYPKDDMFLQRHEWVNFKKLI